jgi:hypothetical protein
MLQQKSLQRVEPKLWFLWGLKVLVTKDSYDYVLLQMLKKSTVGAGDMVVE